MTFSRTRSALKRLFPGKEAEGFRRTVLWAVGSRARRPILTGDAVLEHVRHVLSTRLDGEAGDALLQPLRDDMAKLSAGPSIAELRRALRKAETKVRRTSEARRKLPAGSSRARVTTANAKAKRAAEERDRLLKRIAELEEAAKEGAGS